MMIEVGTLFLHCYASWSRLILVWSIEAGRRLAEGLDELRPSGVICDLCRVQSTSAVAHLRGIG